MEPATLWTCFVARAEAAPDQPAVWSKQRGAFQPVTWRDLLRQTRLAAAALADLGVKAGDRVAQVSENRLEWLVVDLALHALRAVHAPLHASLGSVGLASQIRDAGARVVLLSGEHQAAKLAEAARGACGAPGEPPALPDDLRCVAYDPCSTAIGQGPPALWADLLRAASEAAGRRLDDEARAAGSGDDLASILYTSGSTGQAKGVTLTQANFVSNARAVAAALGQQASDRRLSFLPWSHVFARTCDLYTWLARDAELAIAEKPETVLDDAAQIRPTLVNAVPYFYSKVLRVLRERGLARQPAAARDALGGALHTACSGGAPLPDDVFEQYQAQDILILQGYGLTETSPVISASSNAAWRRGSVGRPVPGVEVRVADDGEILTRGPHVTPGYWNQPEATARVLIDGWFHTGDLGHRDPDGFLYIVGRKKEIIVMSNGKKASPSQLEALLTSDDLILQALVVGDGRDHLAALLVPDPDALRKEIVARGIAVTSREEALAHPAVRALYDQRVRARLAGLADHEQVRKFRLLDRGFSQAQGELTPKLSVVRGVLQHNFRDLIESLYARE